MSDYREFNKIPRLSRECVITEKIDGTNAQIFVDDFGHVSAGNRTRWITPGDDNFGFAQWVAENSNELEGLGPGSHFGEWWGAGIQRGYGLTERRFSLFNTSRWADIHTLPFEGELGGRVFAPNCCHVVPVMYSGVFDTARVDLALSGLRCNGSAAAPAFARAEGVVVYHVAGGHYYKKTCEHDDEPKNAHVKKERAPRPPKDPSKGGRRVAQVAYEGSDRRKA